MAENLFLRANGPTTGVEPFLSDGTTVTLLSNLESGNISSMNGTFAGNVASLGDQVLFAASGENPPGSGNANNRGVELWSFDGSTVSLLDDINLGAGSSNPFDFNVVGSQVFFLADPDGGGPILPQVRFTDGSGPSTIVPGLNAPTDIAVFGTQGVVRANTITTADELFLTDGTFAGTKQITSGLEDFDLTPNNAHDRVIGQIGNTMLVSADNGINNRELFLIDTSAPTPTHTLVNINPAGASDPANFTTFNGLVYFAATNNTTGRELYVSNGSSPADPETPFDDIRTGIGSSNPDWLTVFNGSLYFTAIDNAADNELWITNGIPGAPNTRQIVDINPTGSSNPTNLTVVGNHIVFAATQNGDREIFATDGTDANAVKLADINTAGSSNPNNFILVGDEVFFTATGTGGALQLWKTDGTVAGTQMVNLGGNSGPFPLAAIDINNPPDPATLSSNTVAENSPAGTTVGTVAAVDIDGDPLVFTLINDGGGAFQLVGNALQTTAPLDFETQAAFNVTVRATDPSGAFSDAVLAVNVTDVNEAPTAPTLSNSDVDEDAANGTVIGTLASSDPDAGDTPVFSLVDDAGGLFGINGNNLVVADELDFETDPDHQITVRASDGSLFTDANFIITVNDVDEEEGTAGPDVFTGTPGDDVFDGLGGDDTMTGNAGNDSLTGGDGADRIFGNTGNDIIRGGTGDDRVFGDEDNDLLFGDGGNDTVVGGAGSDTAFGGDGDDNLSGGEDQDGLFGGDGDDFLAGGDVQDRLFGGDGNDILLGEQGRDLLVGDAGNDTIVGGTEADRIQGGDGDDEIDAGEQNDRIDVGSGANLVIYESGDRRDRVFSFDDDDVVDLSDFGFANFSEVEDVVVSRRGNTIFQMGGDDTLILIDYSTDLFDASNVII